MPTDQYGLERSQAWGMKCSCYKIKIQFMSPRVESSVMVDVHWHRNNQHALEKLFVMVPRQ